MEKKKKGKRKYAKGDECAVVFCANGDVHLELPDMPPEAFVGDHVLLATAIALIATNKSPSSVFMDAVRDKMTELKESYLKSLEVH